MNSTKIINFKKSEVSYLANFASDVLSEQIKKDTTIKAGLEIYDSNENKAVVTASVTINGNLTYLEAMRMLRRKLSAYITLKAARLNLSLEINDKQINNGLFTVKYIYSGKRIERYKVFNALFILSAAANENMELIPTGDDF